MLVVFVLGTSWLFFDAFATAPNRSTIKYREENAATLLQAKLALIGWVARKTAEAGENNPGRVPCPEAPGYIGTANEGIAAGNCTLPAVGRLPWRTLGLPKLRDASGEPLWYVVSAGWALPSSSSMLTINSHSTGQLTLDGTNAAVALIVAPGRALDVQASSGCTARQQSRSNPTPDYRDYLECENASSPIDVAFVSRGPSASFNDQVVGVTTNDLLPVIEAAITERIGREIVPALKTVYGGSFNVSAARPVYPYAATFANPGPGGASPSDFRGVAGTHQGLLPFNQTQNCTAPSNPPCIPDLITWSTVPTVSNFYEAGGWGWIDYVPPDQPFPCIWDGDARVCDGWYQEDSFCSDPSCGGLVIGLDVTFSNVALGLRALDATKIEIFAHNDPLPFNESIAVSGTTEIAGVNLNPDGSATIRIRGTVPNINSQGWGTHGVFRMRVGRAVIGDHPLLDPANPTTGWFVRNEWYRLLYYAVAPGQTAANLPTTISANWPPTNAPKAMPLCAPGTTCLSYQKAGSQEDDKRAIVLLAGRRLPNQTRPSATRTDYLDTTKNTDLDTLFEQARIGKSVNDRAIIVDQN